MISPGPNPGSIVNSRLSIETLFFHIPIGDRDPNFGKRTVFPKFAWCPETSDQLYTRTHIGTPLVPPWNPPGSSMGHTWIIIGSIPD